MVAGMTIHMVTIMHMRKLAAVTMIMGTTMMTIIMIINTAMDTIRNITIIMQMKFSRVLA